MNTIETSLSAWIDELVAGGEISKTIADISALIVQTVNQSTRADEPVGGVAGEQVDRMLGLTWYGRDRTIISAEIADSGVVEWFFRNSQGALFGFDIFDAPYVDEVVVGWFAQL
jgi:hypothetical protein